MSTETKNVKNMFLSLREPAVHWSIWGINNTVINVTFIHYCRSTKNILPS